MASTQPVPPKTMIKTTVNTTKQVMPNGQVIETTRTLKERVPADTVPKGMCPVLMPPNTGTSGGPLQALPTCSSSLKPCPPMNTNAAQSATIPISNTIVPCPIPKSDLGRSTVTSKVSNYTMVDPLTGQQKIVKKTTTTIHPVPSPNTGSVPCGGRSSTATAPPCGPSVNTQLPGPCGGVPKPIKIERRNIQRVPVPQEEQVPNTPQDYSYYAPYSGTMMPESGPHVTCSYDNSSRYVRKSPPKSAPQSQLYDEQGPSAQYYDGHSAPPYETSMSNKQELETSVRSKLLGKSKRTLGRVQVSGSSTTKIQAPIVMTQHGPERALQQLTLERRVDRGPDAEIVTHHLTGIDTDRKGQAKRVDINLQQYDPQHICLDEKQSLSIVSSLTVSPSSKQIFKVIKKESNLIDEIGRVAKLVEEENKEVEETFKLLPVPPRLIAASLEAYPLERKNQEINLKMSKLPKEPVVLRQPTADDAQNQLLPEAIAKMVDCFENGLSPSLLPDQVFNKLYPVAQGEPFIRVNNLMGGPLGDAIVTADSIPKRSQMEAASEAIKPPQGEYFNIPDTSTLIGDSGLTPPTPAVQGGRRSEFQPIDEEASNWSGDGKDRITTLIGALPLKDLKPVDISVLPPEVLISHLNRGIEYFLEAEKNPYQTYVQIRGTQPPSWFPGYFLALRDVPGLVQQIKSPNEVFPLAWKSVHPKFFPVDSVVVSG